MTVVCCIESQWKISKRESANIYSLKCTKIRYCCFQNLQKGCCHNPFEAYYTILIPRSALKTWWNRCHPEPFYFYFFDRTQIFLKIVFTSHIGAVYKVRPIHTLFLQRVWSYRFQEPWEEGPIVPAFIFHGPDPDRAPLSLLSASNLSIVAPQQHDKVVCYVLYITVESFPYSKCSMNEAWYFVKLS